MYKKIIIGLSIGGLLMASSAFSAPTSTIVQNLYITGLSSSGSPCLVVSSVGLVATSTCGGTPFATSTLAGLTDTSWLLTSGNSLITITTSTSPSKIVLTASSSPTFSTVNGINPSTWLTGVVADSPLSGSGTSASHLIFTNPGYLTSAVQSVTSTAQIIPSAQTGLNVGFSLANPLSVGTLNANVLNATTSNIGTLNITGVALSPLVISGSATTTIYGDANTSTFGGSISVPTGKDFLINNTAIGVSHWTNDSNYISGVVADSPLSGSGTSASHLIFTNPGYITATGQFWTVAGNNLYPTSTSYLVGVGTTTPQYALDVNGSIRIASSTAKFILPDTSQQTTGYRTASFTYSNATTSVNFTHRYFFTSSTLVGLACDTAGGTSITLSASISATSSALGSDVMGGVTCTGAGFTTSTFSNSAIANARFLLFSATSTNSTTTLNVSLKLQDQ